VNNELYKEAIDQFGEQNQLMKFREEMLECLLALERYFNNKSLENLEEVKEEITDVRITMSQAEMICFFNDREKSYWLQKKENKLRSHINRLKSERIESKIYI